MSIFTNTTMVDQYKNIRYTKLMNTFQKNHLSVTRENNTLRYISFITGGYLGTTLRTRSIRTKKYDLDYLVKDWSYDDCDTCENMIDLSISNNRFKIYNTMEDISDITFANYKNRSMAMLTELSMIPKYATSSNYGIQQIYGRPKYDIHKDMVDNLTYGLKYMDRDS